MKTFVIFLFLFFLVLMNAKAEENINDVLMLSHVLKSSARHYPEIRGAIAAIQEKEGRVLEALGSFDSTLEGDFYNRIDGYYDGRYGQAKIVKPFQEFGAKASLGYRLSDGDFPVYEDYFFSNDGGEASGSLSLSLLKGRDIDPKRFKLSEKKLQLDQASIALLEKQLDVQFKAYTAYLEWVALGHIHEVYQSLLDIALERESALTERVNKGDAPQILLTENQQFILQRQQSVLEAKRKFDNASNLLSIFVRDENGYMRDITQDMLPKDFPYPNELNFDRFEADIDFILDSSPAVKVMETENQLAENEIALGENNILPGLDLAVGIADDFGDGRADFGSGGRTRSELESTIKLTLSVPLQTRSGEGLIKSGRAKREKAEIDKNFALDKLRINLQNVLNNCKAAKEVVDVTENEIDVTDAMAKAERIRFENGQSDFFIINIRENNKALAKIKNIEALKYLSYVYAEYLSITLNLEALEIE